MMVLLPLLLLLNALQLVRMECSFTDDVFECQNISFENFVEEIYRNFQEKSPISQNFVISVQHANFSNITYFPTLPIFVNKLIIESSFVEEIGLNAFKNYYNFKELDFSDNSLTNISFFGQISSPLWRVDLSKNNIVYIDNVFLNYPNLMYLDLSYNHIMVFDLTTIHYIDEVNLFHNEIIKILPSTGNCRHNSLNLGRNSITSFNESDLQCSFSNLDLSYNKLDFLQIYDGYSFYNLSGNRVNSISRYNGNIPVFNSLDLSNQEINVNQNWTFQFYNSLTMSNNKISYLSNDSFDLKKALYNPYNYVHKVFLSNCSILDIQDNYFTTIRLSVLDLTNNNISILRSNIFNQCHIENLILSYSHIQSIQTNAFSHSSITSLELSHNEIEYIKNVFDGANIYEIDLSYNNIQTLSDQSFGKSSYLKVLKFSNCQIEKIQSEAFVNLDVLETIDLSYNQLITLEMNMFSNLSISALILNGNNIRVLEKNAFNNLQKISYVDLTNNSITSIPTDLFVDTPNLEELRLAGNLITHMEPISNEIELQKLSLTVNGSWEAGSLANINLRKLVIQDSEIDVLKSDSFKGLFKVIELNFTGTNIYSIDPGALSHLYQLKFLDTRNLFKIVDTIRQKTFQDMKHLNILDMSYLSLKTLEKYSFYGMENLKTLELNNNNITSIVDYTFSGLVSLLSLNLSNNNIQSISDHSFYSLERLKALDLSFNNLKTFKAYMPSTKSLHLEHNIFSIFNKYVLPSLDELERSHHNHNNLRTIDIGVFQYLSSLTILNLSYNQLEYISIGLLSNLKELKKLDLSHNDIYSVKSSVFLPLVKLTELFLDNNLLSDWINFRDLAGNWLKLLEYVGISHNKWKCDVLSNIMYDLKAFSINYEPLVPDYDSVNINGIACLET